MESQGLELELTWLELRERLARMVWRRSVRVLMVVRRV